MSYNPLDPKDLINPTKLENYINPLSPYGPKNHLFDDDDDDDDDDDCIVENAIGVFFLALITFLILPMLIMIVTS